MYLCLLFEGDACVVMKLHEFLDAFRIINTFVKVEHRPPVPAISVNTIHRPGTGTGTGTSRTSSSSSSIRNNWTQQQDKLLVQLAYQSNGDWTEVSETFHTKYGIQKSTESCLSRFVEFQSDQLLELIQDSEFDDDEGGGGDKDKLMIDNNDKTPTNGSNHNHNQRSITNKKLSLFAARHLVSKSPASINAQDLLLLQSAISRIEQTSGKDLLPAVCVSCSNNHYLLESVYS